ncbi:LytR family transcriptional regulator [Kribbella qitaiheensis]|uniref:LytR family transcriptional regulator n=1 Tax=Kribbella qitaiheensis TaxID=1544730 RepID=A0A7G6X397_9ACTN|nr:LCP family protein [Kribbella qitaiheensis]QNE20712.1 LytR family transcriptional regulator [Kribbella qitaiheensis]
MSQPQPIDPRYVSRPVRKKRRNWFGRLIGLIVLLFLLMLICVPLYAWSRIDKVDAFPAGQRPAETPGTTYLMVGSDSREGLSAAEKKKLGTGSSAGQRTDTIMLLHVPESGPTALISIPRDSYVAIPGHGKNKINAAFSFGGPKLLIQTIEGVTGLHVDHYVEVGFGGFASIIDSVGGVQMCLPKAMKDQKAHINLPKGCQKLDGTKALGYVRARYSDPLGDLGRVQRQREMIGAVADKAVSPKTVLNPLRYYKVGTASADALTIDNDMGPFDLFKFAKAMKAVAGGGNGVTLTVPISDTNLSTPAGSAVKWDTAKAKALFQALKEDKTSGLKSS